ncbi:MAG: hypothetical protein R3245_04000, partial [Kiloniellales bacterium]|nr:hypothetical protein [Kiloniellales bacterium]
EPVAPGRAPSIALSESAASSRTDLHPYSVHDTNETARQMPSLVGIKDEVVAARRRGEASAANNKYSLADALSDALWRKKVAESLRTRSKSFSLYSKAQ